MGMQRRNVIGRTDAIVVAAVAAVSGALAALAGTEPTGETAVDAVLAFGVAALVTWLGASAPWWALGGAAAVVTAGSVGGAIVLTVVGAVAAAGAIWVGARRANLPVARATIAGVVVQVALRLDWDPFFLASAVVAAAAMALIAVPGWLRRQRYVRRRVLWGVLATVAVAVLAGVGLGVAGLQARTAATDGYQAMLDGLELMEQGDAAGAADALRLAATDLRSASDDLGGVLARPASLLPGIAQNRAAASELVDRAATAADAAAGALAAVDLERLRVVDGVIDVLALEALAGPMSTLETSVLDLRDVIDDASSPWLVGPFQERLATASERVEQVAGQSTALRLAAEHGPALLGVDEPRRYVVAFVNSAEARGQSGLMGNWAELTITAGRLRLTDSGRTAELQRGLEADLPFSLTAPEEYFDRYSQFGAGTADDDVDPKFWSNVTMPPDMPTVGDTVRQLYEASTDRPVDGVFVVDPFGIAALLDVTGPIEVPGLEEPLTSANAAQFLIVDQYELAENEREDFLATVTVLAVERVLDGELPPPQEVAAELGPVAVSGSLSAWAARPEEQALFQAIGMDAALPVPARGTDSLAVVTNNASANKIDSFLERTVVYRPTHDGATGETTATLEVTLTNTAPTSGYPDYVIGSLTDEPTGTNRTMLSIYSPLGFDEVAIDGEPDAGRVQQELGHNVYTVFANVPPGGSVTVTAAMSGRLAPGQYELAYRPQPLPRPDRLVLAADSVGGADVEFDGTLTRRSILTAGGVAPWRPAVR